MQSLVKDKDATDQRREIIECQVQERWQSEGVDLARTSSMAGVPRLRAEFERSCKRPLGPTGPELLFRRSFLPANATV